MTTLKNKVLISTIVVFTLLFSFPSFAFASHGAINNEVHQHHIENNAEENFAICPDCNIKVYECEYCGTFNALEDRRCEYCQNKREAIFTYEKKEDYRNIVIFDFVTTLIVEVIAILSFTKGTLNAKKRKIFKEGTDKYKEYDWKVTMECAIGMLSTIVFILVGFFCNPSGTIGLGGGTITRFFSII